MPAPVTTYKIDGTDLGSYARVLTDFIGSMTAPEGLGTFQSAAGKRGGSFVPKVRKPFEFTIPLELLPDSAADTTPTTVDDRWAQWLTNRDALLALVDSEHAALTVERITHDDSWKCSAELAAPVEFAAVGGTSARVALTLRNLDGYWWDGAASPSADTVSAGDLTVVCGGTIRTNHIVATFAGSAGPQVLTNTTTGHAVTVTGATTSTSVVLDVLTDSASAGGSSAYARVTGTYVDGYALGLAPGTNTFTLTGGGTVALSFRAATL